MSEAMLRQILKMMPVGYALHKVILNDDGSLGDCEYVEVNAAFETITGFKASAIVGKRISEVMPTIRSDVSDIIAEYAEVMNGGCIEHEQHLHSLGKAYKVSAFSPEQRYFITLITDISKEKARVADLADNNRLLTDFLNSSPDLIFLKDNNLRHIYANEALANLTGRLPQELIGKDDYEIYPHSVADSCKITDAAVLNSGHRSLSEELVLNRDFDVMKFPVHYPDNTVGVGAFIKDITERKRQEHELKMQIRRQSILTDVFMKSFQNRQELVGYALQRTLELTESQWGYIYIYNDRNMEFLLESCAGNLDGDASAVYEKNSSAFQALIGEAIRVGKPIIRSSGLSATQIGGGIPSGDDGLDSFMSVPILADGMAVAVALLINKAGEFTDNDATETLLLLQGARLALERSEAMARLAGEREKYHSILDEIPALVCEFLPDCTLTFANKEYCSFFGTSPASVVGKPFLELVKEEELAVADSRHRTLTAQNRTGDYEVKFEKEGETTWHRVRDIGIFDDHGEPLRYCSIGLDITEQKAFTLEKERMLSQMDAMFNGHEAVMLLIEPASGKIIDANPSAAHFYGYSRDELLSMRIQDINQLSPEEVAACRRMIVDKTTKQFTFPHRLKSGEVRMVDVYSSPITFGGATVLFSITFDVTEREDALKNILYVSYHDYLTGAFNRRYFEETFKQLNTPENFPLAVITGDVNGLKLINDSFGQHEGDELIKTAAVSISGTLGSGDIFARVGGDEFGVILPKTTESAAAGRVRQMKKAVEQAGAAGQKVLLSISFGYAIQKEAGEGLGKLMQEAEDYMYSKKFYDSRSLKGRAIEIIMNTLFEKSPMDKLHSERVGNVSAAIAMKLGFSQERVNKIRVAGFLHDIGKIGIPENILNKNGVLTPEELEIMRTHPERSRRILENSNEFSDIADIVLYHHEKWDGSGYPEGLKGNEIPLEARIIATADAYDAMTFDRSYRKRISSDMAIQEMLRCKGTHFDPKLVEVLVEQLLTEGCELL